MISTSNYLKRTFCELEMKPIPFSTNLAFKNAKCPYTVMISTRNWMATNTTRKTSSNGNVLGKSVQHMAAAGFAARKKHLWHGSTVNPAPFLGSSLVLLSFRSQHNLGDQKKTTQDATKTRSDINIPSGTLPFLHMLTANIWTKWPQYPQNHQDLF